MNRFSVPLLVVVATVVAGALVLLNVTTPARIPVLLAFAVAVRRVHHHRPVARQRRFDRIRSIRRHANESRSRRSCRRA